MYISLKCWDGQYYRDALRRIKVQFDRGTRHCVRERLARHSATRYTATTMKKTLCERGVIQRNTSRRDVWDEMNWVERLHCVSERPGRIDTYDNNTVRARYTTRCEGESGTVWVRRQTQCERIKILVVWRTDTSTRRRHVELVEVTKRTVNGVPPERKPLLYRLMCTQSYSPVRRNHWVYICIYISCVSRECEYSFHLSLCNVYLENERVYSFLVSLENECVYLFHVHLSTHWSLSVKTSRIFVSTGQLYFLVVSLWCTDRTPNVGGWYPFGVYKLTKEDTTQLQV